MTSVNPKRNDSIISSNVNWISKKEDEQLDFTKYVSEPISLANNVNKM
jgi:hypothetical protein